MLFICYANCSTCRRAQEWLDRNGLAYTFRDIREARPTEAELRTWLARSGLPLQRFFNSGGLLYRALELRERLPEMTEAEQLRLLAGDGMLVRRPLLVTEEGAVLVGFREAEWAEALCEGKLR